ncbi:Luciferase-like monooxygenase [Sinosporangium album]|uniref:Luciferase-like monooxygenase n=1 Tax=Sinosporangium album TaxID=504805 RepID=A0A1G7U7F7_9ACTN|nr:LLM class flavin-dependent oxidoreductase [Sinosporangium album]SDG43354.1 Luciferase-like monooxygenase [Sinosporangium album]
MKRQVQFGLNADGVAGGMDAAQRIVGIAERSGIEYVGIQDHPYNPTFYDTFSVITWLAARTEKVRFFPNVANLPLRPPAMLAKQAAAIDALSGGRFELGLGAGAFAEAISGMGGPSRTTREAREALSEAIDILRATWAGRPFSFEGEHYRLAGTQPGPSPAHEIGIWVGATGPRAAALIGAKADGWSVSAAYVPPAKLPALNEIITGAAKEAGRDPDRIVRLYNLMGLIGGKGNGALEGPVDRWVETITALYTEYEMNMFVFWPTEDRERQSQIFAEEVAPAVRAALARRG